MSFRASLKVSFSVLLNSKLFLKLWVHLKVFTCTVMQFWLQIPCNVSDSVSSLIVMRMPQLSNEQFSFYDCCRCLLASVSDFDFKRLFENIQIGSISKHLNRFLILCNFVNTFLILHALLCFFRRLSSIPFFVIVMPQRWRY